MAEGNVHPTMPLLPDLEGEAGLAQGTGLVAAPENLLGMLAGSMDAPEDGVNADVLGALRRSERTLARDDGAWRGLMAMALLWDTWAEAGAALSVREVAGDTPFSAMVLAALRPSDKAVPLRLAVLSRGEKQASLGLLDARWGILPSAQAADLSGLLPARVTWYDRAAGTWVDPTQLLNERDRQTLMRRLPLLQGESARRFASALLQEGLRFSRALAAREEDALHQLTARAVAICGLKELPGLTVREDAYAPGRTENPLLGALGLSEPEDRAAAHAQRTWLWQGKPFARASAVTGLEAVCDVDEAAALARTEEACGMLAMSARWQKETARRLADWLRERETVRGFSPAAGTQLHEVQREMARLGAAPQGAIALRWPWDASADAAAWLVRQCLGDDFVPACAAPFSPRLTLLPDAAPDALGDDVLARACCLPVEAAEMHCLAIPPLSPEMARVISARWDCLTPTDFRMDVTEEGGVEASFTLHGQGNVTFTRVYGPEELTLLQREETPTVAVWPSVAFPAEAWRAYHVYSHGPGLTVRALREGRWADAGAHMWSVLRTETFPRCLTLHREGVCLGTLLNLLPEFRAEAGESAVIALDPGMTGTAAVIRQGTASEPMHLPCLVRTLLHGSKPAPFAGEFLPAEAVESILPSTATLLRQTEEPLPLVDGHIAPATQPDTVQLKWHAGAGKAQRLQLHQVMLTAALCAKMRGAPSVTWRVSLPSDLSPARRSALMEEISSLASMVAREACLPLTGGVSPVLALDADTALAAYMKGSGYQRGGFLSVDVGSGGAAMMLWLRGMSRPCAVTHLSLGVQGMLLQTLMAWPDALMEDFAALPEGAAREAVLALAEQLRQARGSRRALERSMLLLDECLGPHLPVLMQTMNDTLARGGVTLTQSLLLAGFALLMTTAGLQLERAWRDATVNDHLPLELPLCLAGRGSLLLTNLPETLQLRLLRFARLGMSPDNAVRQLHLAASAAPKMEIALGLARVTEGLQARAEDAPPLPDDSLPADSPVLLLRRFLTAFAGEFPLAVEKLYPGLMDQQGRLTDAAEERIRALMQMHTVPAGGVPGALAACLEQLRTSL